MILLPFALPYQGNPVINRVELRSPLEWLPTPAFHLFDQQIDFPVSALDIGVQLADLPRYVIRLGAQVRDR